jgi:hypothetical protein
MAWHGMAVLDLCSVLLTVGRYLALPFLSRNKNDSWSVT